MNALVMLLVTLFYGKFGYLVLTAKFGAKLGLRLMLLYLPATLISTGVGLAEFSWDERWWVRLCKGVLLYPWGGALALGGGMLAIVLVSRLLTALMTPMFIVITLMVLALPIL